MGPIVYRVAPPRGGCLAFPARGSDGIGVHETPRVDRGYEEPPVSSAPVRSAA